MGNVFILQEVAITSLAIVLLAGCAKSHSNGEPIMATSTQQPVHPPPIEQLDMSAMGLPPIRQAELLLAIEKAIISCYGFTAEGLPRETLGPDVTATYRFRDNKGQALRLAVFFMGSAVEAAQKLRATDLTVQIRDRFKVVSNLADEAYGHGPPGGMLLARYKNIFVQVSTTEGIDRREAAKVVMDAIRSVDLGGTR